MGTTRRALLASLLLLAVAAPAAVAGTVEVGVTRCEPRFGPCPITLHYVAAPGERNDLVVSETPSGEVRFQDAGAPVTAGNGCRQVARDEAVCPRASMTLAMGDGDDAAAMETQFGLIEGEAGDDRLTGGAGTDTLSGGPGTDELHGGAGDDVLDDFDTAEVADTFDGGPGSDDVSYALRRTAIVARLAGRVAGGLNGEDALVDVEGVIGGSGSDLLVGSGGDDDLDGGGGRDELRGRGGDDRLQGGLRTDELDGGRGDDKLIGTVDSGAIFPRPRRGQDRFRCGRGKDIVERADLDDLVISGCDGVEPERGLFLLEHPLRPVLAPRAITSPVIRIANAVYDDRRVVMRLREPRKGGRILGATVVARDGAGQRSVRLNALGRALLAQGESMRVGVEAFERGGDPGEVARFRMVLRRPSGG